MADARSMIATITQHPHVVVVVVVVVVVAMKKTTFTSVRSAAPPPRGHEPLFATMKIRRFLSAVTRAHQPSFGTRDVEMRAQGKWSFGPERLRRLTAGDLVVPAQSTCTNDT